MALGRWMTHAAVVVSAAMLAVSIPQSSQAQEKSLFQLLFGGGPNAGPKKPAAKQPRRPAAKKPAIKKQATARRKPKSGAQPDLTAQPDNVAVIKAPDARTVLVIGDFMAGSLADGLTEALAANAGLNVAAKSNGSSGLVRQDFHDWTAALAPLAGEIKPAALVIMIGANDRQQMKIGDTREAPLSPAWKTEYERRAAAFANAAKGLGVPVIWVGMPAFKSQSMSADMIVLNDIFRKAAEGSGAAYVDIWDGFADENGAFVTTGPDINGQPKRLRGDDGINFSKAGRRKVAFFAEKPLLKSLGGVTPAALPQAPGIVIGPAAPVEAPAIDRTPPMALNDPELDGSQELLGAAPGAANDFAASVASRASGSKAQQGRADDFRRPAKRFAQPASPSQATGETTGATR